MLGGFFDGLEVGVHFFDDIIVSVDSTRDLAVSGAGSRGEEGEGAKREDGSVHVGVRLTNAGAGASDEKAPRSGEGGALMNGLAGRQEVSATLCGDFFGVAAAVFAD